MQAAFSVNPPPNSRSATIRQAMDIFSSALNRCSAGRTVRSQLVHRLSGLRHVGTAFAPAWTPMSSSRKADDGRSTAAPKSSKMVSRPTGPAPGLAIPVHALRVARHHLVHVVARPLVEDVQGMPERNGARPAEAGTDDLRRVIEPVPLMMLDPRMWPVALGRPVSRPPARQRMLDTLLTARALPLIAAHLDRESA